MSRPQMTTEEFRAKMDEEFNRLNFAPANLIKQDIKASRESIVFIDDMDTDTRERFAKCISILVKKGFEIRTTVKYDKIVTPLDLSLAKMVKVTGYDVWVGKNPNKHQQAITDNGGTINVLSKDFPEINMGLWLNVTANPSYKMEWFSNKAQFIKKLTGLTGNLWLGSVENPRYPAVVIANIKDMEDISSSTVPWEKLSFQQKDIVNFARALGIPTINVGSQYCVNQLESILDEYEVNNPTTIDLGMGLEDTNTDKQPVPSIDTNVNEIPF